MEKSHIDQMFDEDPDWLDKLLFEVEQAEIKIKNKRDNPYVRDLIRVLWPYNDRGLGRIYAIDRIKNLRIPTELPIPKKFDETVQSAFNQHNEASAVFAKSGMPIESAIFFPPGGKGSGKWAVHQERAFAWLKRKSLPDV